LPTLQGGKEREDKTENRMRRENGQEKVWNSGSFQVSERGEKNINMARPGGKGGSSDRAADSPKFTEAM